MHLADAFIQSDLQCIQVIHLLSVYGYICVYLEPKYVTALSYRTVSIGLLSVETHVSVYKSYITDSCSLSQREEGMLLQKI